MVHYAIRKSLNNLIKNNPPDVMGRIQFRIGIGKMHKWRIIIDQYGLTWMAMVQKHSAIMG